MPERQPLRDKLYYTQLRVRTAVARQRDSLRYAVTTSPDTRERLESLTKEFTSDLTSFIGDTQHEQVSLLKLHPVQDTLLRFYTDRAAAGELSYREGYPSYDNPTKKLTYNGSAAFYDKDISCVLTTCYQTPDGSPQVQTAYFISWFEGNWVASIIYHSFSQKPETQEKLETYLARKDCSLYGGGIRFDILPEGFEKPAIFRLIGEFGGSDGQDYSVYGWNGKLSPKPEKQEEKQLFPRKEVIFTPSTM